MTSYLYIITRNRDANRVGSRPKWHVSSRSGAAIVDNCYTPFTFTFYPKVHSRKFRARRKAGGEKSSFTSVDAYVVSLQAATNQLT